ncbi:MULTISPECIES: hypothetical protein [Cyanophyceae]|uniref:hypothetical protein n=1 Tax=Cyanophyceae TaxID=3028117 RepID=UPI00168334A8|nr:hypothetical protein [Trichocoleus sp. FACHB-40]MBD2006890.1 hypothetical protein [Trichocoleus sp. FACHB-40]
MSTSSHFRQTLRQQSVLRADAWILLRSQEQKVLRPLGLGQKSREIKVSSVTAFMVKWHLSLDK